MYSNWTLNNNVAHWIVAIRFNNGVLCLKVRWKLIQLVDIQANTSMRKKRNCELLNKLSEDPVTLVVKYKSRMDDVILQTS